MSLCFLARTSSHYKGRIFIHSLFCSCYQPGDLYIEKLLTLTIKAQSNVKLKVMKRWNCYMLLPILDCVAYGGWFQWLKQVSLVHTYVVIFFFFFTQIKRYDSNFSLPYNFFKEASISFILSGGDRPYAYILIKVNTN